MPSVQVRGKEKLTKLANVLAAHGEGRTIRRRLSSTIRDESDHITREQRANLALKMPHRGGLAEALASQGTFTIRTTLAGKSVGVTIVDSWKGHDMRAIERGLIRHPVFGEKRLKLTKKGELKSAWVSQRVPAELLSKPVMRNQLRLRFAIVRSLDALAAEIAKET